MDTQATLNAVISRLPSGWQGSQLPERFADDRSVHRTFQRWVRLGLFERLWAILLAACDESDGMDWEWQAAGGVMGKARLGDVIGPNPTDRGKRGVKWRLLGTRAADCWRISLLEPTVYLSGPGLRQSHRRRISKEKFDLATGEKGFPTRRWVVERTLAWLSNCRTLLIRYDKWAANFLALRQFACALLRFRRLQRLSVPGER